MQTITLTTEYTVRRQYEVVVPDELDVSVLDVSDWSDPSEYGVSNEMEDDYFETEEKVIKVENDQGEEI